MSELTGLRRLEPSDDSGVVRVMSPRSMDFMDYRQENVLTREYTGLYTEVVNKDQIRVGTATHPEPDNESFAVHSSNFVYYETELIERELTDEEKDFCEDSIYHGFGDSQPDSMFEFSIPDVELLVEAIHDERLGAFECLTARNPSHETRQETASVLQQNIESERFRATKLNTRKGYPIDLELEWDPEDSHNDGRNRSDLYELASTRSDSHMSDFFTVLGVEYFTFFFARARALGVHEPYLKLWSITPFDVLGVEGWAYCRECGAVAPEEQLLHVELRGRDDDKTVRVCERCAEKDLRNHFVEDGVEKAKDENAIENGGQRRLVGEYDAGN